MFTGIIEEVGAVAAKAGSEVTIIAEVVLEDLQLGDSIAVDGACLTVSARDAERFTVQVSPETFARTTLAQLKPGHAVNLERAMAYGGRVGGHFVQGHVDGVGRVADIQRQGDFFLWRFQSPVEVSQYLVPRGSVAVDGISLTVVEPAGDTFGVAIIPTTLAKTTLSGKQPGDAVNLEADMLGKQVYHYLKGVSKGSLTMDLLKRQGFA